MRKAKFIPGVVIALLMSFAHTAVAEDDYAKQWGPKVGTPLPAIAAADETGATRDFDSLAGENGLLILFNRSASW